MNLEAIKKEIIRFKRARGNLLAVVGFTAINLLLYHFGMDLAFLFSAFVPQFLQIMLVEIMGTSGAVPGLIVGLLSMSVYVLCYFLAKRWRVFMLVALILFIIDALIMLGFVLLTGDFGSFIFDIAFHAWILFYLINGTAAWVKLGRVSPEMIQRLQEEANQEQENKEYHDAINSIHSAQPKDEHENDSQ